MRKFMAMFAALAFVVILVAPALAATQTVTGQIVDQACYAREKSNTGVDHKMPRGDVKDCAIDCAKKGRALALLTSDGKVYTIGGGLAANNNEKLVPHVSHTVEITGDVTEKDGAMTIAADGLKMVKR